MSLILEVDQSFPQPGIIEHLTEVVKNNHGIFVYPTDTIYGLGCSIKDLEAIKKIRVLKERQENKTFSILFSDINQIKKYAQISKAQEILLKTYLPGPFTFILKAKNGIESELVSQNGTIGVRIPQNKLCWTIVKSLKSPIITTSVNLSGEPPLTNPKDINSSLGDKIDVILDAGELPITPSTVVDLTLKPFKIIRQGVGVLKN